MQLGHLQLWSRLWFKSHVYFYLWSHFKEYFLNDMWNESQMMTDNILCLTIFQKQNFPWSHLLTGNLHEELTLMSCIRNRNLEISFSSIKKRFSNSWIPSIRRQTEVIIKNYLNLHFLLLLFRKIWLSRTMYLVVRSSPVMLPSQ